MLSSVGAQHFINIGGTERIAMPMNTPRYPKPLKRKLPIKGPSARPIAIAIP